MLQVYSQEHERLCLLQGYSSLAITTQLADGDKKLTFQYPRIGKGAEHLKNECYIRTEEDEYVLKEVSGGKKWRSYVAQLNLEDLQGKSFVAFETVEKTVTDCLSEALAGTGWQVGQCDISKKRTIRKDNVCTVLDIIAQCIKTYKVEVQYHTLEKVIDVVERVGSDKGAYFMEAVNLRRPPEYSLTSTGLYTQIRPIGKGGLQINVNGKDYIENHSYSPKNLMLTWKDERYTIEESLLEDAALKLEELCRPTVTYEVDVIDLAKASEAYQEILAYSIGDTITLVSKTEGIKEKMRIAVITEYPDAPQNNTCQLSTAKKTFADIQQEVKEAAVAEAVAASAANALRQDEDKVIAAMEDKGSGADAIKAEVLDAVRDEIRKTVEETLATRELSDKG
ncbi:MAG: hypothetical protein HFH85_15150 [Lachnospiraceae bacterium]|jgi:phage minor structural protein|nr:hypothetical protein [Lachnospiraceae bacterium]